MKVDNDNLRMDINTVLLNNTNITKVQITDSLAKNNTVKKDSNVIPI